MLCLEKLQSLFTWIFYLFFKSASLLAFFLGCFNPYSPGFSIYFKTRSFLMFETLSFNPYSPGFSIYLNKCFDWEGCYTWLQSLFTWIFYLFKNLEKLLLLSGESFNPYSPGFSIYFVLKMKVK